MKKTETKQTRFKVGLVTVVSISSNRNGTGWELRWQPEGRDVRRRVFGLSREEIVAIAENMTRETYCGRGYLPGMKAPTISEAIATALRLSAANPETKANLASRAQAFVRWLAATYPSIKTWDRLKPHMVQEYIGTIERAGQAYDSIRLRLAPIRTAWRLMAENHPELVNPLPKLRMPRRIRQEIECLSPGEVDTLLGWLKTTAPDLWAMGTLQALCGLRMLEAAALRSQDVDWDAGIVTIAETSRHKPKTRESLRTIPVCSDALMALHATASSQVVVPITGELFPLRARDRLSGRWTWFMRRAARELGNPRYGKIPARKLRAAFATMAGQLGLPDRLLKAYMGHVAGDILGAHYRRIGLHELRRVSVAMEGWRAADFREEDWKLPGNQVPKASAEA